MVVLGVDTSHHNPLPDFAAMAAAGIGFAIPKVTEGSTFVDPQFAASRAGAHAAGLVVGGYHFARLGDPQAEAAFFLATMRPQPGELTALDLEVTAPGVDPVAWAVTWSQAVKTATGAAPLLYLNQSLLAGHDWSPVVAVGDGLWLAKYDGQPTGGPTGPWPVMAVKQYTDRASVPGQPGQVDGDAFQGTLDQLRAYTIPAPAAPACAVQGEIAVKYHATPGLAALLGPPTTPESPCPDGVGRYNHFANDNGSIYWTPSIGAFSVHGAIAAAWASLGWERSPLGYPVSDEFGVDGYDRYGKPASWRQSNFEHGAITWTPAGGAVARVR